ncbi:MAG: hypothetical protein WC148_06155 [Bacilli bacterium]
MIFGKHNYGSNIDFESAELDCNRLINFSCYESFDDINSKQVFYDFGSRKWQIISKVKEKNANSLSKYDKKAFQILKK